MATPPISTSPSVPLRSGLRERNLSNQEKWMQDEAPRHLNLDVTHAEAANDCKGHDEESMAPTRRLRLFFQTQFHPMNRNYDVAKFLLTCVIVWQVSLYTLLGRGDTRSSYIAKPRMTTAFDPDLSLRTYTEHESKPLAVHAHQNESNVTRLSLGGCRPMYKWQTTFYPTCNSFHEIDFTASGARFVDNGAWRIVWELPHADGNFALKTLREGYDVDRRALNGQIVDAIVAERASSSPHVASIYNFCGTSALYDFASNGTLSDNYQTMDRETRLRSALQAAKALRDIHGLGGGVHSAVVHADIAVRQFVYIRGEYQLNDFNTAGLLKFDKAKNETCPFTVGRAHDKNRAPEEYFSREDNFVTEKADIYSLGNIFYKLIMDERKYSHVKTKYAEKLILAGDIPILENGMENSTDPVVVALKKAMHMCLPYKPKDRATARQVADFLQTEWDKFESSQRVKTNN